MSRSARRRTARAADPAAARSLAELTAAEAVDRRASDVVLLDLRGLTSATDWFVLASGESETQVKSIADRIEVRVKEDRDAKPWHVEGRETGRWVLLDYVDVVVHVFHRETRDYYELERLWADAPMERFGEDDGGEPADEGE